jgi:predicted membrane GTPase involved in stress response
MHYAGNALRFGVRVRDGDERVEITPDTIRIRKKIRACRRRPKRVSVS